MDDSTLERFARESMRDTLQADLMERHEGGEFSPWLVGFYIDLNTEESRLFVRRFASLVAEECAKICEELMRDSGDFRRGECAHEIRKRFK